MTAFRNLHKYYVDCFEGGVFDKEKVILSGLVDNNYETEFRLNMLEKIYSVVLDTKLVRGITLNYIKNSSKTYDDIVDIWNKEFPDNKYNINTGKSKIVYCGKKINEIFIDLEYKGKKMDILEWLFEPKCFMGIASSPEKIDLRNEFIKQFNEFSDIYGTTHDIDKKDLLLVIPTHPKVSKITDDEYENFIDIIRPYSRHIKNTAQNLVNSMYKEVGYFRFLFGKYSKLTEKDKERKEEILLMLGKNNDNLVETLDIDIDIDILDELDNFKKNYKEMKGYKFDIEDLEAYKDLLESNSGTNKEEIIELLFNDIIVNKISN